MAAWNRFGARLSEIFIGRPIALRVRTVRILRIVTGKQLLVENSTTATEEAALSLVWITNVIDTTATKGKIKAIILWSSLYRISYTVLFCSILKVYSLSITQPTLFLRLHSSLDYMAFHRK